MTPNSTSAALAILASTGRPMATSESFMPQSVLSGVILYAIDERGAAKSTQLAVRTETWGNAARFHVGSKANQAPSTLQGLCASRLMSPVRMNGIETGATQHGNRTRVLSRAQSPGACAGGARVDARRVLVQIAHLPLPLLHRARPVRCLAFSAPTG